MERDWREMKKQAKEIFALEDNGRFQWLILDRVDRNKC